MNGWEICGEPRADGQPCQRKVRPGTGPCFWHAKTFRRRLKAWAKNQTLGFTLSIIFGSATLIGLGVTIHVEFFKPWLDANHHSEQAAFSVAVEVKLLVPGPMKDIAGTGFWGVSKVGPNCFLRSADVVMLIRIKNLQQMKTMITAYNVYAFGGELDRINMLANQPINIMPHGVIPPNLQGKRTFPVPVGRGNVNGGLFEVKFADTDFSVAAPIVDEILDREIANHYLEPGDTIRG
jgi:hypothetical protein